MNTIRWVLFEVILIPKFSLGSESFDMNRQPMKCFTTLLLSRCLHNEAVGRRRQLTAGGGRE